MFPPRGEVEDPVNRPEPNYTQQATIGGDETDYLTLTGAAQQITPLNDDAIDGDESDYLTLTGNYFFNPQGVIDASTAPNPHNCENFLQAAGTVDLGVDAGGWNSRYLGSKYVYTSFASSGSNPPTIIPITSSRYDEHEAVQPVIITNTYSSQFAPGGEMYDQDIYFGRAFTGPRALETATTIFSSSAAVQNNLWTSQYGMRLLPNFKGSKATSSIDPTISVVNWAMNKTNFKGLGLYPSTAPAFGLPPEPITDMTASISFDTFHYQNNDPQTANILYKTSITAWASTTGPGEEGDIMETYLNLSFGKSGSLYTQNTAVLTETPTTYTFTTKADGNQLVLASYITYAENHITHPIVNISKLVVQPLNYRAQVQDYHLITAQGMVNARYEGCKLTSTDYNVDSLDTVDGGPVITITLVGGTVLANAPAQQLGTFEIQ